jgi:hypothetical protein
MGDVTVDNWDASSYCNSNDQRLVLDFHSALSVAGSQA